jgi:hypothetical protein
MPPPDVVVLVASYLRAQDHLAGVTVATGHRPDDVRAKLPLLLVEAVAHLPRSRLPWARTHRMCIGISAWAGPEPAAVLRLIRGALAALLAARAVTMPGGGRIDRVEPRGGPEGVPDPAAGEGVHRMVATVDVTLR